MKKLKEKMDKKFLNILDKSLNNLESEFKKTMEPANQVSKLILEVEDVLNGKGIKIHFSNVVKKDEDEAVIFDWRKAEGSKKYRLHYIKQSNNHMVEARPFIEASLDERLQYVKYIPKFIDNFTLFLKELRED